MVRSSLPSAPAAAGESHIRTTMRAPENWRAREVRERAICELLRPRTVNSTASLRSAARRC
eukprot:8550916-Lingulodinium_polyedra.AAC.1